MPKYKKILLFAVIVLVLSLGLLVYFFIQEIQKYKFKVSFLDVGQGDATLIQFANGQEMLVDCGKDRKILSQLGQTLPFYDREISYLLVTHPDADHYGGCIDVLENYKVQHIVLNGHSKSDSFYASFADAVAQEGADVSVMRAPDVWHIASTTLEFLSPDPSLALQVSADDSNDYSIVFRLAYEDKKMLFTADMETPLEQALLVRYCAGVTTTPCSALSADILKVGHHGSDTSSSDDFLRAVGAKTAVVSVGKNNRYGHPSLRVLRRLERSGAEILRTDIKGNIFEF